MHLTLTPDLQQFLDKQIAEGTYHTPEDVLRAALTALKQQQEFGQFEPGELESLIAEGEESIRTQGAIDADKVFSELRQRSAVRKRNRP